ncbi:Alpha/Beta hydrolase protein [Lentinula raphanica]|nr:Alpha/Beta hydrolase protein [Lentinula raphanica]
MFSKLSTALLCMVSLFAGTVFSQNTSTGASSLDQMFYKDVNVTRGLTYHYYFSPPSQGQPVLMFLHGFLSSSSDWHNQIEFFQNEGYGLIVPDMLGYGGTAKPVNPELYKSSLISQDMVDLLDAENVEEAIVVGHDWGSKIVARLANYFPECFSAFGFVSVGYFLPSVFDANMTKINNLTTEAIGYEIFGYWDFFSSNGADTLIESHLDSFYDLMFPNDTVFWITDFAPEGKMQAWLEANRTTATGNYERDAQISIWRDEGMAAAVCWYIIVTSDIERNDDQGIPQDNLTIKKPVFFGAALRDYVAIAASHISRTLQASENTTTIHEYNSGHWAMFEVAVQLNSDLLAWVESL